MRVLMLGWEFPPFITGGLGTACYGLTKALSRQNAQVVFVLPKVIASEYGSHVRLLSPQPSRLAQAQAGPIAADASPASGYDPAKSSEGTRTGAAPSSSRGSITFKTVAARAASPYQSAGGKLHPRTPGFRTPAPGLPGDPEADDPGNPGAGAMNILDAPAKGGWSLPGQAMYQGDLLQEAHRYAQLCVRLALPEQFDVIHAHDWLTFPAGLAVAAATGKPLVVHVHSTEFDRAGENIHPQVFDIERRGMHGAIRIIAVSHLTRSIIIHRYGVAADKVEVVYNGIENAPGFSSPHPPEFPPPGAVIRKGDKIVLFLGRITMQKGPEYFVHAAKKVLEKFDRVKFVMAGSGDKIGDIIELAAAEGIGHKVLFTGFLHGPDVERIFRMADVYVMPSVSEPFGIAPLEAISHDVPVIISKTSGVSEVLTHALKVDFWDIDEMANKIIAVLKHPPLSSTLREHADMEVRRLTWDDAATRCLGVYANAIAAMPR